MAEKPTLNADQKEALKAILKFLDHPSLNVFVLKGYAGTGKTFLMQQLAVWLKSRNQKFVMLASTGRAASVLKGKTGFAARTVHSELYNFDKVDGLDAHVAAKANNENSGQISMQFTTRKPDEEKILYIVDEASMLSSDEAIGDDLFATFGSGFLLNDFFEVAGTNKIIFVGDPCQLPPVKQDFSPALDMDWLKKQDRVAVSVTLEKIERTDAGNDILKLASDIRGINRQTAWEKWIRLPARNLNNVKLHASEDTLFQEYVKTYKKKGTSGALAIARSNRVVQHINSAMREQLFGELNLPLQVGDVLLVTQNNRKIPLTNGDFVVILTLGETELRADLRFQSVRIKAVASDKEYNILLVLDTLYSSRGDMSSHQMKALVIDFHNRMIYKGIPSNSPLYHEAMGEDDYLNSLKTTFGYAVTCHKSQGGEWDDIFLFLDKGMYHMPPPDLSRWWYTAVTRARKELNLANEWWVR